MELTDNIIMIIGAGEKASAVAHVLFTKGFKKIIMTDIALPRAERRAVCFCEAAFEQEKEICGVVCEKAEPDMASVNRTWSRGKIPLLITPNDDFIKELSPNVIVDSRMAKKHTGSVIHLAPLVIALGPGFCAGKDAHYVIETNPGNSNLGKIIESGCADEQTGIPTPISGLALERVLRSPATGTLHCVKDVGDPVQKGEKVGYVGDRDMLAPISGYVWGIIRTPAEVKEGRKLGDIYPGNDRNKCLEITPQAKIIAEGVRQAIIKGSSRKV